MIDLHTHSSASDGSCSPAELYRLAASIKLSAIALTDHDTTGGLAEFMASTEPDGPEAVPGVEISVEFGAREVHLVGLFISLQSPALETLLCEIRRNRNQRNEEIILRLQNMGFEISLEELRELAGGDSIGRPLFAKILVDKGYFTDPQSVFDQCLARGAPAYVKRLLPAPEQAIEAIHNAGGFAFWAHSLHRSKADAKGIIGDLEKLVSSGLDGIEAYYSSFNKKQTADLLHLAEKKHLMVSGGSDFHGKNKAKIKLGAGDGKMAVPDEVYQELLRQKRKHK